MNFAQCELFFIQCDKARNHHIWLPQNIRLITRLFVLIIDSTPNFETLTRATSKELLNAIKKNQLLQQKNGIALTDLNYVYPG